jgi:hypothetical protein
MTSLETELAECLRQCRAALETLLAETGDDIARRVIARRIDSANRVLAKMPKALV